VIFFRESNLIMNFGRAPLVGSASHPRSATLPSVTPRQLEALDAIEAIARATELQIRTQAGDMHFINNLAILHRRDSFVDGQSPTEKRHLVRMRLRSSTHGWDIPDELKQDWTASFSKSGRRVFHLDPMPEGHFPLRTEPN
jgi:hypothetical protein